MFVSQRQLTPSQSLSDIVREETDNGRLIVRFLVDLMQGSLEDAKPCHRLDAARQLLSLGCSQASVFIAAHNPPVVRTSKDHPEPLAPLVLGPSKDPLHHDLAALICEETEGGRVAVRFLVDVMQGNLQQFKPHHRLSAAKELLSRGFDAPTPALGSAVEAEADDNPRRLDPDGIYYRDRDGNWQRDNARSPGPAPDDLGCHSAEAHAKPSPRFRSGNRFKQEYGPFFFESYDNEDFRRDCFGDYALKHVLGSEQAVRAATLAVQDYRRRADQSPPYSLQSGGPFPEWSPVPADAPRPEAIYGYPVLLYIYGSEGAARVAAHAACQYYRGLQAADFEAGKDTGFEPRLSGLPGPRNAFPRQPADPPPEHPPPSASAPGPARIRLDGFPVGSVDSVDSVDSVGPASWYLSRAAPAAGLIRVCPQNGNLGPARSRNLKITPLPQGEGPGVRAQLLPKSSA